MSPVAVTDSLSRTRNAGVSQVRHTHTHMHPATQLAKMPAVTNLPAIIIFDASGVTDLPAVTYHPVFTNRSTADLEPSIRVTPHTTLAPTFPAPGPTCLSSPDPSWTTWNHGPSRARCHPDGEVPGPKAAGGGCCRDRAPPRAVAALISGPSDRARVAGRPCRGRSESQAV